jgi:hypothetical protein
MGVSDLRQAGVTIDNAALEAAASIIEDWFNATPSAALACARLIAREFGAFELKEGR